MKKTPVTELESRDLGKIVSPLLKWYDENKRPFPWRENAEPYTVWVSEIMLQQTTVETVRPYFRRFIKEFPDIKSLADAPEERVLKLWEGLGYYTRARNLQKAARIIVENHAGRFPSSYEEVLALPGIGKYTAGAICSIAFGQPVPAVDGNVLRLIARFTGCGWDVADLKVKDRIAQALRDIYPPSRSGDFTQSLMELGAVVCQPRKTPECESCPLRFWCRAYRTNAQAALPVKSQKKPRKKERKTVFLLRCGNKIALRQRDMKVLLGGLWEFPNLAGVLSAEEVGEVLSGWGITALGISEGISKTHIFTHRQWHMRSYVIECGNMPEIFLWATRETLERQITLPTAFQGFQAAAFMPDK